MRLTTIPALLCSLLVGLAAANSYGPKLHHCSYEPGTNVYKTTIAYPVSDIIKIIGVFQKGEWQGIPISSTSGKPNARGAKRNLAYDGMTLGEVLTFSHISNKYFEQKWHLYDGPVDLSGLILESYYEHLVVRPTCDGKASKVIWTVDFCSNNETAANAAFMSVHAGGIATVVKDLGGKKFTKCEDCYY